MIEDAYRDRALEKIEVVAKYNASKTLTSAFLQLAVVGAVPFHTMLGFRSRD